MKLAIVGCGGHAKEVYNSLKKLKIEIDGFYIESQYFSSSNTSLYNLPIKILENLDSNKHLIHIAVGDIEFRDRIYTHFKKHNFTFSTIIDPDATISDLSEVDEGSYIAPGSILTANIKIGKCVIVNTGSVISHDCTIDDFCNIAPRAVLCGNVKIGKKTIIGAGALIKEKSRIGNNVFVGMGTVVTKNILDSGTYILNDLKIRKLY